MSWPFLSPVDPCFQVVRLKWLRRVHTNDLDLDLVIRKRGDQFRSDRLHGFLVVLRGIAVRDGAHPDLRVIPPHGDAAKRRGYLAEQSYLCSNQNVATELGVRLSMVLLGQYECLPFRSG